MSWLKEKVYKHEESFSIRRKLLRDIITRKIWRAILYTTLHPRQRNKENEAFQYSGHHLAWKVME